MQKMIIAIDFDGTLVKHEPFPCFKYEMLDNAEEVIRYFDKLGIEMILNTCRYTWYRLPAIFYIKKHKLPIKTVLFNKKPHADLYIDDCNIFCKEIDWLKIKEEVENLIKERNK